MARETIAEKALRYVAEQRLTVERVDPDGLVVASCRGETGRYKLGWDPVRHEFRCTCEASRSFKRRCSHVTALALVVERSK